MGKGSSALKSQVMPRSSGKGGITSQQTSQNQYASPLSGLDAIYGQYQQPSAQPSRDMLYRGVPQQSSYLTNPYAAPFQQRYVQQFYPEAESFVPQSAENYRSPFAGGMGGKGGRGERIYFYRPVETAPPPTPTPTPTPSYDDYYYPPMASGGVIKAAAGRYLQGPGDGTSDSIPATIGNAQPARLADGEFVIDARTVSEIGNGSSNAGAKKLYAMMERVHRERKKAKRGQDSNADRYLPA